jgi:hypothetical protein
MSRELQELQPSTLDLITAYFNSPKVSMPAALPPLHVAWLDVCEVVVSGMQFPNSVLARTSQSLLHLLMASTSPPSFVTTIDPAPCNLGAGSGRMYSRQ